jgi:hypothetical protein
MATMTETAPDPMEAFKTTASIMAFVYAQCGVVGLRELLSLIDCDQETLLRDAEELKAVGLPVVEAIVREVAATAPSARELYCPYEPEDRANYQSWQQSYDRRIRG